MATPVQVAAKEILADMVSACPTFQATVKAVHAKPAGSTLTDAEYARTHVFIDRVLPLPADGDYTVEELDDLRPLALVSCISFNARAECRLTSGALGTTISGRWRIRLERMVPDGTDEEDVDPDWEAIWCAIRDELEAQAGTPGTLQCTFGHGESDADYRAAPEEIAKMGDYQLVEIVAVKEE